MTRWFDDSLLTKRSAIHQMLNHDQMARTRLKHHVDVCIDGNRFIAALQLNLHEHNRRVALGLGALSSTGLLHALWEIPRGLAWPMTTLSLLDQSTLEQGGLGWVEIQEGSVSRLYEPPGQIMSVSVVDRSLAQAVRKASVHPPTVTRYAIWKAAPSKPTAKSTPALDLARLHGIGVIAADGESLRELAQAARPVIGRPVVFRWWQAELAYRNWLMQKSPIGIAAPWD